MEKEKKIPDINSKVFYKLITEYGETVAKNTAEKAVKGIQEYLKCHDTCTHKSNEMYYWMGFRKLSKKYIPVTYISFALIAVIALLLSLYNYFHK